MGTRIFWCLLGFELNDLCYSLTLRTGCWWIPGSSLTEGVPEAPGYTCKFQQGPLAWKIWENRKPAGDVHIKCVQKPSNTLKLATSKRTHTFQQCPPRKAYTSGWVCRIPAEPKPTPKGAWAPPRSGLNLNPEPLGPKLFSHPPFIGRSQDFCSAKWKKGRSLPFVGGYSGAPPASPPPDWLVISAN